MEEFLRWVPLLLVLGIALAILVYNNRNRPAPGVAKAELVGIAGWLLFPAIMVVLTPLAAAANGIAHIPYFKSADGIEIALLVGSIAINAGFAIASFILATRFFQYKRETPNLYVVLTVAALVYFLIDYLLVTAVFGPLPANSEANQGAPFIGVPGFSVLWAIYMKMSVRVQNTFTR